MNGREQKMILEGRIVMFIKKSIPSGGGGESV